MAQNAEDSGKQAPSAAQSDAPDLETLLAALPPSMAFKVRAAIGGEPVGISVSELLTKALDARRHATKGHRANARTAHREFLKTIGEDIPASQVRPADLRAFRDRLIGRGLTQRSVCDRVGEIRSAFRWAAEYELIEASQGLALGSVRGPRGGEAQPNARTEPVDLGVVRQTLPHMPEHLRRLTAFLALTGCRVGEARLARLEDIDANRGELRPLRHKTAKHGVKRRIPLSMPALEILREAVEGIDRSEACLGYVFSPDSGWSPFAAPRLRRELDQACVDAGVEVWQLRQLRHTAATAVRSMLGLDAASELLGHTDTKVTGKFYAQSDGAQARAASEHLAILLADSDREEE